MESDHHNLTINKENSLDKGLRFSNAYLKGWTVFSEHLTAAAPKSDNYLMINIENFQDKESGQSQRREAFSSLFEQLITWRQLHRRIQLRQKTRLVNLSFLPNIPSVGGALPFFI